MGQWDSYTAAVKPDPMFEQPTLRRGVGNLAHAVVALDEKRALRLAERDACSLGGPSERGRVFRNEIDLRLAAAERESEEAEQVHAAVSERREDPLALCGRLWNRHVVVLDASFAATAAARLDEQRVAALEQRLEADLALGRDRELIGELETLVAELKGAIIRVTGQAAAR